MTNLTRNDCAIALRLLEQLESWGSPVRHHGSRDGDWITMGVPSDGSYGVAEGVMFGYPVTCSGGRFEIGLARIRFARIARVVVLQAQHQAPKLGDQHVELLLRPGLDQLVHQVHHEVHAVLDDAPALRGDGDLHRAAVVLAALPAHQAGTLQLRYSPSPVPSRGRMLRACWCWLIASSGSPSGSLAATAGLMTSVSAGWITFSR